MPQSSEGLIVAVVEDDPRMGELIHEEICDEGHGCKRFRTAEAFLNDVEQLKPDLVLLDLMLPGMDGLQCLRTCRHMPGLKQCPLVIVTALNDSAKRREYPGARGGLLRRRRSVGSTMPLSGCRPGTG